MKQNLLKLKALLVVLMMAVGFGQAFAQEVETLASGSGTSGYQIPEGWESTGTVAGGQYLKFDGGTITSPMFEPHTGLSFSYSVATFGSGTNHPLTVRILNASTDEVIIEKTTTTPTSSTYISTGSPLSLGDVKVAFKIQLYGPSGKGVRLRNYSITGTPGGGPSSAVETTTTIDATGITNTDVYAGTAAGKLSATVVDEDENAVEGATVTWSGNNDKVAIIDEDGVVTLVGKGNVTFTAVYAGVQDVYSPSSNTYVMTVTDSAPKTGAWVLTDLADLAEGDIFVIVGNDTYAMSNDNGTGSAPAAVAVTIQNDEISSDVADNIKWNISGNATDGYTFYPDGETEKWLYCSTTASSGSNNNIRVGTGDRKVFEMDDTNYLVTNDTYTARYVSIYNASDWRGYINTTTAPTTLTFYKYVAGTLVSLEVSGTPTKTEYEAGDVFNTEGLVVTGTYSDQSKAVITKGITWTLNPTTLSAGDTSCGVTATVGEISSEEYVVSGLTVVTPKVLTGITVTGTPAEFWKGDTFNHDGMTVTANYGDETSADVTDEAEFTAPDMTTAGVKTVTVTYKGNEDSYNIEVKTIANTAETAYTTAEAIALIDAGKDLTSEVYVKGVVSSVDNFNPKYYSITYWLDNNAFEVYSGKGIAGADFVSIDDIEVGAQVVVKGKIKKYNTTYEFDMNNELVSYVVPANMRITEAGCGTFCSSFAVEIPEGVTAYYGEMMNGWIKLNELTEGYIPGGLGVVVYKEVIGDAFKVDLFPMNPQPNGTAMMSCFMCNLSNENMNVSVGDYLLQRNLDDEKQEYVVGWYKVEGEGFTLAPYRCYLSKDAVPAPNQSRTFFGFTPDDATGISSIATEAKTKADGKYMVNGQIVVVKAGKAYNMNGTEVK